MEKKPLFIVVSQEFSGFGLAKAIEESGYPVVLAYELDEETAKEYASEYRESGKGYFEKKPLAKMFAARDKFHDAYWIFDQNNHSDLGQVLHDEGFKVWGGSKLMHDMEHDREFGVDIAKRAGLDIPEYVEFNTTQEGMDFLDQNPDKAYVFKPDPNELGWETYVPDSEKDQAANGELFSYLQALPEGSCDYILQERKRGVETNFEIWCHKGKPFFAFCDLECKKKLNDDMGPLVGGAQDINFTIPLESRAVMETVGKLLELEEYKNYTGFLDMNVIVSERHNYFLEFCARMGYPSHPTLFTAMLKDPLCEVLMEMIDGPEGNFYKHFKHGFGAGITLYTDKTKKNMPIYVADEAERWFYPYDLCKQDDLVLMAGAGEDIEVGVITGHGYTVKTAAEEALANMRRVNFPNRSCRTDLDKNCYASSPQARYDALVAMRYI